MALQSKQIPIHTWKQIGQFQYQEKNYKDPADLRKLEPLIDWFRRLSFYFFLTSAYRDFKIEIK